MRSLLLLAICTTFAEIAAYEARRANRDTATVVKSAVVAAAAGVIVFWIAKHAGMLDGLQR